MNAHRAGKSTTLISVFAAILLLSWIGSPAPGLALMALPADIGINYQTMTVKNAAKLTAVGMKDAKNGDRITNDERVQRKKAHLQESSDE
jgi:hypothetical protein